MPVRELLQLRQQLYYRLGFLYVHIGYPMYIRCFLGDRDGRPYEFFQECVAILIDNRNLNRFIFLFSPRRLKVNNGKPAGKPLLPFLYHVVSSQVIISYSRKRHSVSSSSSERRDRTSGSNSYSRSRRSRWPDGDAIQLEMQGVSRPSVTQTRRVPANRSASTIRGKVAVRAFLRATCATAISLTFWLTTHSFHCMWFTWRFNNRV